MVLPLGRIAVAVLYVALSGAVVAVGSASEAENCRGSEACARPLRRSGCNYVHWQRSTDALGGVFGGTLLAINHAHTTGMFRLQCKVGIKVFTTSNFLMFSEKIFCKYVKVQDGEQVENRGDILAPTL